MDFLTPEEALKQEIKRVLDTHFLDLERKKIVLTCRFDGRLAMVAPEGYPGKDGDLPVFTYRELYGLYEHGNKQMFNDLYDVKTAFPEAIATGMKKRTIAGGFVLP